MQTQIHAESLLITLGLRPVPEHFYKRKVVSPAFIKRRMTKEERITLLYNIAKHKTLLGDAGTAEFIYYEMLDAGEIPTECGVILVGLNTFPDYYKLANYQLTGRAIKETKICPKCNKGFERRVTLPLYKWKKQVYCSQNCACLVTVANRVSKANERKQAEI